MLDAYIEIAFGTKLENNIHLTLNQFITIVMSWYNKPQNTDS